MFQCKDLLILPSMEKARVIAGKEGLDRGIRWAYKAESLEFPKWVHGQELLIVSTPVIKAPEFDLFQVIEKAVKHQMSAVLLLAGEDYVQKISREVLRLCTAEKFPVIALPWNVPLLDVFEELGHAIAYHDHLENDKEDLLSGIIFGNHLDVDVLLMQSEMIGYDMRTPQAIFAVQFLKEGEAGISMPAAEKETAVKVIGDIFSKEHIPVLMSYYGNHVVGIFRADQGNGENVLVQAGVCLEKALCGYGFYFGCGRACECLEELKESFQEASKCIALGKRLEKKNKILFWEKIGFYKLLLECGRKPLEQFFRSVIGGLLLYDSENNTKLLETLEVYLEQNCSLKHTAQILYTHPNTIKYRVQRIREITGKSPETACERMELYNAVLIWKFLQ